MCHGEGEAASTGAVTWTGALSYHSASKDKNKNKKEKNKAKNRIIRFTGKHCLRRELQKGVQPSMKFRQASVPLLFGTSAWL